MVASTRWFWHNCHSSLLRSCTLKMLFFPLDEPTLFHIESIGLRFHYMVLCATLNLFLRCFAVTRRTHVSNTLCFRLLFILLLKISLRFPNTAYARPIKRFSFAQFQFRHNFDLLNRWLMLHLP